MRLTSCTVRMLLGLLCCVSGIQGLRAQNYGNNIPGMSGLRPGGQGSKKDSLHHRTGLEDTITISFRYLDSTHIYHVDSSVGDVDKFYVLPAEYQSLGNTGNAAKPVFYSPLMKAGWDAGFHSFDVYRFTWDKVRFYTTTRPYTDMEYLVGSSTEQDIHVLHTQNINRNWNFAFEYRLTGGSGAYRNQKVTENSYGLWSWYDSPRKRYHLYGGILANNFKSADNGGIPADSLLEVQGLTPQYDIPVNLGNTFNYAASIFSTVLQTGTQYKDFGLLLRQQYDIGQQDSIVVNDSTTYYLFYPRLRLQHTLEINTYNDAYVDGAPDSTYHFYQVAYDFLATPLPGFLLQDKWVQVDNDFALYQFPVAKNQSQYLTEGLTLENLGGTTFKEKLNTYNVFGHAEYRNQTRNKKWDIELNGKFYFVGFNSGDYIAHASLSRFLGKKVGYLRVGAENVNRTPSFIFTTASSFNFSTDTIPNLDKENYSHLFADIWQPLLRLHLSGHYYLMDNYSYWRNFYIPVQDHTLFNILQLRIEKDFRLGRFWHYYGNYDFQQPTGTAPVHLPLFYTRSRFAFEGFFYRKLAVAVGIEVKYATPYKEDMYSPLLGQFFPQEPTSTGIPYGSAYPVEYRNRPDVAAYFHFRLRTFYLIARAENLNSFTLSPPNPGFTHVNRPYVGYADPGLVIRVGVRWVFVN